MKIKELIKRLERFDPDDPIHIELMGIDRDGEEFFAVPDLDTLYISKCPYCDLVTIRLTAGEGEGK